MNRKLENTFFAEFQYDGAALLALKMALNKYCGIGSDVPARPDYPDGVLAEIAERTESMSVWPWHNKEDICPLLDEIEDNLDSYNSIEDKRLYVENMLMKFRWWTFHYNLGKEKLNTISNVFYHNSLEQYYRTWLSAYKTFAEKLAVVLVRRGLNILEIQEQCEISIIEKLNVDELWMYFGSRKRAEECLSRVLHQGVCETPEDDKTSTPNAYKFTHKGLYNLFEELKEKGYIKGKHDVFVKMCRNEIESVTDSEKLRWVYRNGKSYISLFYMLKLIGIPMEKLREVASMFFNVNPENSRDISSKLKGKDISKSNKVLAEIINRYSLDNG